MNSLVEQGTVVMLAIVGVALAAILVSSKSNTSGVLQSTFSGFSNFLGVAESPVTGSQTNLNLNYPGQQSSFGLSMG